MTLIMDSAMRILIHCFAFLVSIGCSLLLRVFNGFWEYRVGAALTKWEVNPFALPFEIGSIVFIYVLTDRFLIRMLKCTKSSGKEQAIFGIAAFLSAAYIILLSGQPLNNYFVQGFKSRVDNSLDPNAVELWKTKLASDTGKPDSGRDLKGDSYPDFFAKVRGEYRPNCRIYYDHHGQSDFVVCMSGGGFRHYGLIFNLNGSSPTNRLSYRFIQLSEGIWVFCE